MSFGAMAAWQAWALLAATAGLITWIFFIKIRAPRITIPSLILWQRVLDATRDLTWWERVRRAVSWFVITATGLALILALARPAPRVAAAGGGRRLIVIDSAWSMGTEVSGGGSRWDHAISDARTLIAAAAGDEIALATTADGLVEGPTTDTVLLESALQTIAPAGGEAEGWPQLAGVSVVHFLTDGTIARRTDGLTASGATVLVQSVFEAAANVAITAFEARAARDAESVAEAYLELANYAPAGQRVRLVVTRGTVTVADTQVDLAAGEVVRQVVPLGKDGESRVRARITAPNNALLVDDEAVAWVAGAEPLSVTIVSDTPGFLQVLFGRLPGVRANFIRTSAYGQPRQGPEHVLVFDHWVPGAAPNRPALFVMPPQAGWLGTTREEKAPRWATSQPHPVLDGVDASTVTLERVRIADGEAWMPIARSGTGVPLVSVAESPDARYVALGFGFAEAESNVALQPAFPVVITNAIEWLARPSLGRQFRPGIVMIEAAVSQVTGPDGRLVPVTSFGDRRLARLKIPGLYLVEGGGIRSPLVVNVGDPLTSNVLRTSLAASVATASAAASANDPWWPFLIGVAFVLAIVEWLTWHRRITV